MDLKESLLNQLPWWFNLSEVEIQSRVETAISKTYLWMWIVLLLAFATGYGVFNLYASWVINPSQYFIWSIVSALLWLWIVFWMIFKWSTMSYTTLAVLFLLFWLLEWFWLWNIFIVYKMASIINVFLITSVMFFILSFVGYYLKVDVTKLWSILMVWLIALLVWFLINMFWQNSEFNIWLNVIWIVIFSWFIVYDMASLKQMAVLWDDRLPIIMWLWLFLNFINIFMMLLNLIWNRNE